MELAATLPVLASTEAVRQFARVRLADGAMPRKAAADALHVGVATIYGCEFLITWNCRHIANSEVERAARMLARSHGYELPIICTPEELMGEEA